MCKSSKFLFFNTCHKLMTCVMMLKACHVIHDINITLPTCYNMLIVCYVTHNIYNVCVLHTCMHVLTLHTLHITCIIMLHNIMTTLCATYMQYITCLSHLFETYLILFALQLLNYTYSKCIDELLWRA